METLYFDESGDLGFSASSSKHFVIGFIVVPKNRDLTRRVKKVRMHFSVPHDVEIKAKTSGDGLKRLMLEKIRECKVDVHVITIYKDHVEPALREDTNLLYNYASALLLIPFFEKSGAKEIRLTVDQRTVRVPGSRDPFDDYLKAQVEMKGLTTEIRIEHLDSRESLGLQAVDFVVNALFRAREYRKWDHWNIIRDRVPKDGSHRLFEKGK